MTPKIFTTSKDINLEKTGLIIRRFMAPYTFLLHVNYRFKVTIEIDVHDIELLTRTKVA